MPKTTRSYMVRRGRRYLIERTPEGTFARWIPVGGAKKTAKGTKSRTGRKATGVKTTKSVTGRRKTANARARARY
ncbi:MAG: hypothetical protein AB1489_09440 [Acidobacteriota bacterium]